MFTLTTNIHIMKRIFILLMALSFFHAADAQTEQGNFLVGGNFGAGFSTQKIQTPVANDPNKTVITERRSTSITFNPKIGFFITDGFAIGLDADINNTVSRDRQDNVKSTSSYFTIGPYARYYFPVNLFLEGGAGIGNGKNFYGYGESKVFRYSVGAGFAAFLNDNIALEPMIRYSVLNFTRSNNNDYRTKNGGLEIALGFQIYL